MPSFFLKEKKINKEEIIID